MFKKLKEKITEEVKSSPQRFAEFTQSVSDRLQNSSTPDDNLFSIGEDDANTSTDTAHGFSSISLVSPTQETSTRRMSNSSLASDVSFLPRYEANSMYHLQSDLDISASELEDNVSTSSSQLGHLSKEQIYSAFQKSQMRYHKYRGRYTDLARHYKELEKENSKMKSVLVETQDKAIRRVTELKEQCSLEQKAKAHLESALRDEIDEKNYKIKSLQTKIDLLQTESTNSSLASTDTKESENQSEKLETLTKYLNDARKEIENLNEKIQEMKANVIVFQSKEEEHKNKIANLEKELKEYSEKEKETNLKFAQNKMELHNEILSKETEITALKKEVEILKQNLEVYEKDNGSGVISKMENLQTQNKKLINKLENVTQKCNNLESNLLKVNNIKIEFENINKEVAELRTSNSNLITENENATATIQKLLCENNILCEQIQKEKKEFELQIQCLREDAKKGLLSLEPKIREKLQTEFLLKEDNLKKDLADKFERLSSNNVNLKEIKIQLMQKDELIKKLTNELDSIQEELNKKADDFNNLEKDHLELIEDCTKMRSQIASLEKNKLSSELNVEKVIRLEAHINTLQEELKELKEIVNKKEKQNVHLAEENLSLQQEIKSKSQKLRLLEEKYEAIQLDSTESKLLELKVHKLEEEKEAIIEEFEMERKMFNELLEDHRELQKRDEDIKVLNKLLSECREEITHLKNRVQEEEGKNIELHESKLHLEKEVSELAEKLRMLQEKEEASEIETTECKLLKIKLKDLENKNQILLESCNRERAVLSKDLDNIRKQLSSFNGNDIKDDNVASLDIKLQEIKELSRIKDEVRVRLEKENIELHETNKALSEKLRLLEEKLEAVEVNDTECKLLQSKIKQLEEENSKLVSDFKMERKMFNELLENHKLVEEKDMLIKKLESDLCKVHEDFKDIQEDLKKEKDRALEAMKGKTALEKEILALREKIKLFEERNEVVEMDKVECGILEMKIKKLEEEKEKILNTTGNEKERFNNIFKEKVETELKNKMLEEENVNLKQGVSRAKEEIDKLNEKIKNNMENYSEKLSSLKDMENVISSLRETIQEHEENTIQLTDENQRLHDELEQKNIEIAELFSKISNLSRTIEKQSIDFNRLLGCTKQLEIYLENIQGDNVLASKSEQEKQDQLTTNIQSLERLLDEKTSELVLLHEKIKQLEKNYEEQRCICEEKDLEIQRLNIEKTTLQKIESHKNLELTTELERLKNIEQEKVLLEKDIKICEQGQKLLLEEKNSLLEEINSLRMNIDEINVKNNNLKILSSQTSNWDKKLQQFKIENDALQNEKERATQEMSELNNQIQQLTLDNRNIFEDKQVLMNDCSEMKAKIDMLEIENNKFQAIQNQMEQKINELNKSLEECQKHLHEVQNKNLVLMNIQSTSTDIDISKMQHDFYEIKEKCDNLFTENRNIKQEYAKLEEKCSNFTLIKDKLDAQILELEKQYTEVLHEKQLLQDEIQELKTLPFSYQVPSTSKLDNTNIFKSEHDVQRSDPDKQNYLKEIEVLRDKLTKYKSLDITNKSSIEFYENELQKLKNQNDKLNRRLDETLVTLSHCAELSSSTEIEYLKNVLYNYMLGKESMVLARVIAAVCKFDPHQTELILQKEQQKQSLLGQLGLI